ncbi:MAG TPA: hypothetical protein VFZ07_09490 [Dongiaceae bacterium]
MAEKPRFTISSTCFFGTSAVLNSGAGWPIVEAAEELIAGLRKKDRNDKSMN